MEPKAVPRMVWGLKNLQHESLNSENFSDNELDPAALAWEHAWSPFQVDLSFLRRL